MQLGEGGGARGVRTACGRVNWELNYGAGTRRKKRSILYNGERTRQRTDAECGPGGQKKKCVRVKQRAMCNFVVIFRDHRTGLDWQVTPLENPEA